MLSESCLHKKNYEKNLWYQEFQNTKNFTLSPSCFTFIKRVYDEKEKSLDLTSSGQHLMPDIFIWAASVLKQIHHPFLSPLFSPAAWKHNHRTYFNISVRVYTSIMRHPAEVLTPGLWSALSCRPKRPPPWPPCRGEAVAEDSKLGDWAIMGELGLEVRAPVSVRRCSSLCLCCCSIWYTTICCSWRGRQRV